MENAIWNGRLYVASNISNTHALEEKIRLASSNGELLCPDETCTNRRLKYCHGEKKDAYFSHLANCTCEYSNFDKENTPVIRHVKRSIYEYLSQNGFNVKLEPKILPNHYTHILITLESKEIAIEFGDQKTTQKHIKEITDMYNDTNIELQWIVVTDNEAPNDEKNAFCLRRYLLNKSRNKSVLEINETCSNFKKYIMDPNKYIFDGKELASSNYPNKYEENFQISALTVESNELTVSGFYDRYKAYLQKKETAFEKKVQELEREKINNVKLFTCVGCGDKIVENDIKIFKSKGFCVCEKCYTKYPNRW